MALKQLYLFFYSFLKDKYSRTIHFVSLKGDILRYKIPFFKADEKKMQETQYEMITGKSNFSWLNIRFEG